MKVVLNAKYLNSFKKVGSDKKEVSYSRFLIDDTAVILCKDKDKLAEGFTGLEPHTILCEQSLFNGMLYYSLVQVK